MDKPHIDVIEIETMQTKSRPEKMKPKGPPRVIWLQVGDEVWEDDTFYKIHHNSEVTWCQDKIYDTDIRYVLDKRQLRKEI